MQSRPNHHVRATLARPGFRRLLAARLFSQAADGWFQAGLALSIFFNPERAATPSQITIGFAVLLVPYSVLGPFVGVFLDRWSRRTSLAVANAARATLVVPAAACVFVGQYNALFVASALVVVSVNRFYLAGIGASLPHVVDTPRLVTANSFAVTAGTVCYTISLGAAALTIEALGDQQHNYAMVSLIATVGYLGAAFLMLVSFRPRELGPDEAQRPTGTLARGLADTVLGMVAGLRHLSRRPGAAAVLLTQAGHRMLFGLLTLSTLLLYRYYYSADEGGSVVGLIPVVAAAAAGVLLAAVITPPLVRRVGSVPWLVTVTAALAAVVPMLGVPFVPALTIAASFAVSFGAQTTKIITDTTLQLEVDDDFRGRVFSVNDTGFNLFFVLGLLAGALVLPPTGASVIGMLGAGVGYGLVAFGYGVASRRRVRRTPSAPGPPAPASTRV